MSPLRCNADCTVGERTNFRNRTTFMASGRSYVCHSKRCAALIASTISPSDGRNNSNLEHVTWSDPAVTPSRLAISSRLSPSATSSLIFSIACGVNLTRLPLREGWHSSSSWLHPWKSPSAGRLYEQRASNRAMTAARNSQLFCGVAVALVAVRASQGPDSRVEMMDVDENARPVAVSLRQRALA